MPKRTLASHPASAVIRLCARVSLSWALVLGFATAVPAPAVAIEYPPNYDPMLVISDFNWRDSTSMSQGEIQAFLEGKPTVLKSYSCAEGGPHDTHSLVVKPASQIIFEAAQYYHVSPKLIIATLEKEQSLISQPWHTGRDIDPTSTHNYSTEYHLTNAMGAGVYTGSPDRHPGFGDQVWEGARALGRTDGPYAWYPGKSKTVWSYEHAAYITVTPSNQPTWNFYTYTPYYPQLSVWQCYTKFFGDPRIDPIGGRVYRFYNRLNGTHFYTASPQEAQTVTTRYASTYTFEGPAYSLDTTGTANNAPLYRFYNPGRGSHFYTASPEERDIVMAKWPKVYAYEGPAYNVSLTPDGCVPVFRFYNVRNGSHFYTVSSAERDVVMARWPDVYAYEGVAYYVALAK